MQRVLASSWAESWEVGEDVGYTLLQLKSTVRAISLQLDWSTVRDRLQPLRTISTASLRIHCMGGLHADSTSNLWLVPKSAFCTTGIHDLLSVTLRKETVLLSGVCAGEDDSYCIANLSVRKCWTLASSDLNWPRSKVFMFGIQPLFGKIVISVDHVEIWVLLCGWLCNIRLLYDVHCKISGERCWVLLGMAFAMENGKGNESWPLVCMALKLLGILFWPVFRASWGNSLAAPFTAPSSSHRAGVGCWGPSHPGRGALPW